MFFACEKNRIQDHGFGVQEKAKNRSVLPLRNIGPTSARWLAAIGIRSLDVLRQVGVVNAYNLVKAHGHSATLNLLWALQGALMGVHWTQVPQRVKQQLKARLETPP